MFHLFWVIILILARDTGMLNGREHLVFQKMEKRRCAPRSRLA